MLTHDYADVNGMRLHYVEAGEGKPILFLHGFPEFWYQWKDQITDLSRDHRVIAVDMRGYNLSSKPEDVEQYQITHLVEDVRSLAAHLHLPPFVLIGHDWGGAVAYAFASTYPEQLERLVVINAPHPAILDRELHQNPAQQHASQYTLLIERQGAEEVYSADNYARLAGVLRSAGVTEDDISVYREAWSQPGWLTAALNYYRANRFRPPGTDGSPANGDYVPQLTDMTVEVPTLVIWGEKDVYLVTSNLDGLQHYVPNLTIQRIPDAGHLVTHERPDLTNAYIRDFTV